MLLNVTYLNMKMKSLECVLTSGGGIMSLLGLPLKLISLFCSILTIVLSMSFVSSFSSIARRKNLIVVLLPLIVLGAIKSDHMDIFNLFILPSYVYTLAPTTVLIYDNAVAIIILSVAPMCFCASCIRDSIKNPKFVFI